jgi:hypothetical protein
LLRMQEGQAAQHEQTNDDCRPGSTSHNALPFDSHRVSM